MSESSSRVINGVRIPDFFYGTAWKENRTEELTLMALESGFTAIDTANQRKHYFEEGVGQGLQKFLRQSRVPRGGLFIQTKFTFARGQDHRKPYDENASYEHQVQQSFASSLQHLGVDYLDSLILHGPFRAEGIVREDQEVWSAMEKLHAEKKVKVIGVSNVHVQQLAELFSLAKVKPTFVQNRCYASMGWDKGVRDFCKKNGIFYQGFSLLTANSRELARPEISAIAKKHGRDINQVVFRFSQQIGMIPLTGTTRKDHMNKDLQIHDFELSPSEISQIENIAI